MQIAVTLGTVIRKQVMQLASDAHLTVFVLQVYIVGKNCSSEKKERKEMFLGYHLPGLFFNVIGNLVWLLLLILLISTLIRWLASRNSPWGPYTPGRPFPSSGLSQGYQPLRPLSALHILQQRYARGEIDGVTFDQMRERLEASEPRERSQDI